MGSDNRKTGFPPQYVACMHFRPDRRDLMTTEDLNMEPKADPIAELRQAFVKQAEIIKAQDAKMAAMEKQLNEYAVKVNALSNVPAPAPAAKAAEPVQENVQDAAFYAAMREMGMDIDKKKE